VGVFAVAVGATGGLDGCGGQLVGHTGTAGDDGSPATTGRAGTMGAGRGGAGGSVGGRGGSAGRGGNGFGEPACVSTVAEGGACTAVDQQLCYKTCGPEKQGAKSETCTGGVYNESSCAFAASKDYSCYAIRAAPNAACPSQTPMASSPCEVAECTLCNTLQGLAGGQYFDAAGAAKVGWCVCQPPDAAGMRAWSCASNTAWPCPIGIGCDGTGGSRGTGGGGGVGGVGGAGGGDFGQPACLPTVVKGGACVSTDQQFCYKTCGPQAVGVKAETCTSAGVYAEMSGCTFDPARDYSCYKLPGAANAACVPGLTPQASQPCDAAACAVCNSTQGLPGGIYLDTTGAPKVGYCVCQPPNAAGARLWSCASDTAWPCPLGSGC
jgi:hypothetical protein